MIISIFKSSDIEESLLSGKSEYAEGIIFARILGLKMLSIVYSHFLLRILAPNIFWVKNILN